MLSSSTTKGERQGTKFMPNIPPNPMKKTICQYSGILCNPKETQTPIRPSPVPVPDIRPIRKVSISSQYLLRVTVPATSEANDQGQVKLRPLFSPLPSNSPLILLGTAALAQHCIAHLRRISISSSFIFCCLLATLPALILAPVFLYPSALLSRSMFHSLSVSFSRCPGAGKSILDSWMFNG
jgi:hypothetical protein